MKSCLEVLHDGLDWSGRHKSQACQEKLEMAVEMGAEILTRVTCVLTSAPILSRYLQHSVPTSPPTSWSCHTAQLVLFIACTNIHELHCRGIELSVLTRTGGGRASPGRPGGSASEDLIGGAMLSQGDVRSISPSACRPVNKENWQSSQHLQFSRSIN